MSISVNPAFPVIAAQGAAPDLVLQPGTVIDAQVVKLLADNLVRIAIANLSIDVISEIPLQAGQTLQLAVSQTENGIRLAVVGPNSGATAGASPDALTSAPATPAPGIVPAPGAALAPGPTVAAAVPDALVDIVAAPSLVAASQAIELTPPERIAVSAAVQIAATRQESLAPLFANLAAVTTLAVLPAKLQQAVAQVLAQRPSLGQNLSGNEVKTAFQKSGIFLEATLASGSIAPAAGIPDLKAALIVLRQTLLSSLGPATVATEIPSTPTTVAPRPATPVTPVAAAVPVTAAAPATPAANAASQQPAVTISVIAPSLSPDIGMPEILPPRAGLPVAEDLGETNSLGLEANNAARIVLSAIPSAAGARTMTPGAALNLLQEVLQEIPREIGSASQAMAMPKDVRNDAVTVHTNTPPPPFRGALPSAQPMALPSILPGAPLATTVHRLLDDTESAMARQTLLQVASLPDRVDVAGTRTDPAAPRWSFEIPFSTPQGTTVAQFEISRDGRGSGGETEAATRVWRARFSLDVEPAGPVHALVSLNGERTSVRMWAERPATAAQLRAGVSQLSQALSRAELLPGDIVIRDGAPTPSATAPSGHFLDRAL